MTTPTKISCAETLRRLDDYLDGELAPPRAQEVAAHLEECAECLDKYGFERSVLDTVRDKLRRVEVPAELRTRLERRLATGE